VISWVKKMLERTVAFRKERAKERGVGPKDLEQKRPFLGLKVHSFTQTMRPFLYIFVMFLS
jgi:hypothetical protein